jgi:hypothetical protein
MGELMWLKVAAETPILQNIYTRILVCNGTIADMIERAEKEVDDGPLDPGGSAIA